MIFKVNISWGLIECCQVSVDVDDCSERWFKRGVAGEFAATELLGTVFRIRGAECNWAAVRSFLRRLRRGDCLFHILFDSLGGVRGQEGLLYRSRKKTALFSYYSIVA
jgi:hypothetical protein